MYKLIGVYYIPCAIYLYMSGLNRNLLSMGGCSGRGRVYVFRMYVPIML